MRNFVKNTVMSLLVLMCIIWICCFDPSQFWKWFKIAIFLVSATGFLWWIFDFDINNPSIEDENEKA